MKIELNIEASQLGDTVIDVFKNLTKKEKKDLAEKVLLQWLSEPYDVERNIAATATIEKIKRVGDTIYVDGHKNPNSLTDDQIKSSREFKEQVGDFKSSRDIMIAEITEEAIKHYKEMIPEEIKNDKQLEKIMNETMKVIKTDFPKFVHDAMIAWFAHNMTSMASGISAALTQSSNSEEMAKQIGEKVGINY